MRLVLGAITLMLAPAIASAADVSIDSFFQDSDGDLQLYATITPDRPSDFAILKCFLLIDGKPVDDSNDTASGVTGPTRLSMTFYDPPVGKAAVECRVSFY